MTDPHSPRPLRASPPRLMPVHGGVALIACEIGREARSRVGGEVRRRGKSAPAPLALARDERVGRDLGGGAALANDGDALAGRVDQHDRPNAKLLTGLNGAHGGDNIVNRPRVESGQAAGLSKAVRRPSLGLWGPSRCRR